jgi:hypothetical protein
VLGLRRNALFVSFANSRGLSSGGAVLSVFEVIMIKHFFWAVSGAAGYWFPVILVFAVQRRNTNVLIANLMAMLGFSFCWAIRRWFHLQGRETIWILLGLYFLGPILLSTATTFADGGFARIHGWTDIRWLLLACAFPPLQFLLAATAGLWPSLLIVTTILGGSSVMERGGAVA